VFKNLVRAWKNRRADRIAQSLVPPLRKCVEQFVDEDGEMVSDIRDDDFVLTYIFGVVMGRLEASGSGRKVDVEFAAAVLRQTLEHLFGQGQERAELCATLARIGDEDFKHAASLGYADVREFMRSKQGYPTGLIEHLRVYGA
jgi:hypothetical protein